MLCSPYPLSPQVLQHAVSITLGATDITEDDLTPLTLLVEYCFGFITISLTYCTVELTHYSIHEYLQERRHILFDKAQVTLTKACLNYLMMDALLEAYLSTHDKYLVHKVYPFVGYAASRWGDHANQCSACDIESSVGAFLSDARVLLLLSKEDPRLMVLHLLKDSTQPDRGGLARYALIPQHVLARWGLVNSYQSSSFKFFGKDLDAKDETGATPLMIAVKQGHTEYVKAMISGTHSINLNDTNHVGETPLTLALDSNHSHFFLDRKYVDIAMEFLRLPEVDVNRNFPIRLAIENGIPEILDVMLEREDLNLNLDGCSESILEALFSRHFPVLLTFVKILQRRDFNLRSVAVLDDLLERREGLGNRSADIQDENLLPLIRELAMFCWERSKARNGNRLLGWYTRWVTRTSFLGKHSEILIYLIDQGFDPGIVDEDGNTFLHTAAWIDSCSLAKTSLGFRNQPKRAHEDGQDGPTYFNCIR